MSYNSIVTGSISPVFGSIETKIHTIQKAIEEKEVWNNALTLHGLNETDPGQIDIFLEFPDRDIQKASNELTVFLKYFAGFLSDLHIVYAGDMSLASYNDEDPDDEQTATCSLSSRTVRFTVSENDTPPAPDPMEAKLKQKYKKIWDEAYALGVEDQKTSISMAGVAGCFCDRTVCICIIAPARANPYA